MLLPLSLNLFSWRIVSWRKYIRSENFSTSEPLWRLRSLCEGLNVKIEKFLLSHSGYKWNSSSYVLSFCLWFTYVNFSLRSKIKLKPMTPSVSHGATCPRVCLCQVFLEMPASYQVSTVLPSYSFSRNSKVTFQVPSFHWGDLIRPGHLHNHLR